MAHCAALIRPRAGIAQNQSPCRQELRKVDDDNDERTVAIIPQMARGATMCSSNGRGAVSNTRRFICALTKASARPAPQSVVIWTSTMADGHTRTLTAQHPITPASTRCLSARNYGDGVDGAPIGIDVPRWPSSQPIRRKPSTPSS